MTATYTDAQIEAMAGTLECHAGLGNKTRADASNMLRSLLTERQAGSSGDVPDEKILDGCLIAMQTAQYKSAGLPSLETAYRAGFISACNWPSPCSQDVDSTAFKVELAKFVETHTPMFQPPQPPAKESVRGVSECDCGVFCQDHGKIVPDKTCRYMKIADQRLQYEKQSDNEFIPNNGTRPVDPDQEVYALWSDGKVIRNRAGNWNWSNSPTDYRETFIVGYRLDIQQFANRGDGDE